MKTEVEKGIVMLPSANQGFKAYSILNKGNKPIEIIASYGEHVVYSQKENTYSSRTNNWIQSLWFGIFGKKRFFVK